MAKIKGDVLVLSVHDGSAYRPIACLTSNTLSETRAIIESQTKCDPGVIEKAAGAYSYEISAEGEYIDTTSVGGDTTKASHDYLRGLMTAGNAITWKMDTGLTDTAAYYGTAFITDLSAEAPSGGEFTTFSCTLSGSGSIVTVSPV